MIKRKAILFDCGDTLVHINPTREKIVADFFLDEGISIGKNDILQAYRIIDFWIKQPSLNIRNQEEKRTFLLNYNIQLFKALGLSSNAESSAERLYQRFCQYKNWSLFPDTKPALTNLSEHWYKLGVVANWDNGLSELLKKLRIEHFFHTIISSAETGVEKPSQEIFYLALDKLGFGPHETFYVGNEYEVDVIGARGVGIEPILIDRDNILPFADCLKFSDLWKMRTYLTSIQGGSGVGI